MGEGGGGKVLWLEGMKSFFPQQIMGIASRGVSN